MAMNMEKSEEEYLNKQIDPITRVYLSGNTKEDYIEADRITQEAIKANITGSPDRYREDLKTLHELSLEAEEEGFEEFPNGVKVNHDLDNIHKARKMIDRIKISSIEKESKKPAE